MDILQINNGKKPQNPINAGDLFRLPTETPFGNLTLKLFKIIARVDEINLKIVDVFNYWKLFPKDQPDINNSYSRGIMSIEFSLYLMRVVADEMISLYYVLSYFEINDKFPKIIKMDRIGMALHQDGLFDKSPFVGNKKTLEVLNEISNAFKHSFVNSDINYIGKASPCVFALDMKYNKTSSGVKFHVEPFDKLVVDYSVFYNNMFDWLRSFSNRNYEVK